MSKSFKIFVAIVLLFLLALAILFAAKGNWQAMSQVFMLLAFVAFFVGIGWFHFRFPLPELPKGSKPSLQSEIKRFNETYPGWPGRLVKYGIPLLLALAVVPRVLTLIFSS